MEKAQLGEELAAVSVRVGVEAQKGAIRAAGMEQTIQGLRGKVAEKERLVVELKHEIGRYNE